MNLAIVLWSIINSIFSVLDTPKTVGIIANTIEDLERNAILIRDIFGFDTLDHQLNLVSGTQVRS